VGTPSLTVAPATAQLTSGGIPVVFTAALTGGTDPIQWALDGPGSLSASSGTTISYMPPASLSEDTQATVAATSGIASARATITLTRASGILVTGRVVDFRGTPAPDIQIAIGSQTTVTDQNGRFALGNVSTPYTLAAFSEAHHLGMVFQGLTRPDPTIQWRQALSTPDLTGTVQGTISGGAPVPSADVHTVVHWVSAESVSEIEALGATYSMPLDWAGPTSTTGSVHVLQVSGSQLGLPTTFPGYGVSSAVTVQEAATVGVDVTLTRPEQSAVRGRYSLPEDHVLLARVLGLGFDGGGFFVLGLDGNTDLEFAYPVPGGIDATAVILAEAAGPDGLVTVRQTGIPLDATDVAVDVPRGAGSIAPADEVVGVDAQTDFSWSSLPGSVYIFLVSTTPPAPTLVVVTQDTHAAIPQLPGMPLPSGTRYVWNVAAQGPFGSVDEVAGPVPFTPAGNRSVVSFGDHRLFETR
jgi:hypothetical protein